MKFKLSLLAICSLIACQQAMAMTNIQEMPLDVNLKYINNSTKEVLLLDVDGTQYISKQDFVSIYNKEISLPTFKIQNIEYFSINDLGSLEIDLETLRATIILKPEFLPYQAYSLNRPNLQNTPVAENSLFMNYSLEFQSESKFIGLNLNPTFTRENGDTASMKYYYNSISGGQILDLNYKKRFENGEMLTIGNNVTGSRAIGGQNAYLGLQFKNTNDLDPYSNPYVATSLTGTSQLEGVAEIYLNGQHIGSQALRPGEFRIDDLYNPFTSNGTANIIIRDVSGRVSTISAPLLGTPLNLKQGTFQYTLDTGLLGADWKNPGKPFVSGTASYGLSNKLTLQGHAEASKDVKHVAVSAIYGTSLGTFKAGLSQGSGSIANLGYFYQTPKLNFKLDYNSYKDYQAMGSTTKRTENTLVATARVQMTEKLNLNMTFAKNKNAQRFSVGSNFRLSNNANLQATISNEKNRGWGAFLTFTYNFSNHRATTQYDSYAQLLSNKIEYQVDTLNKFNYQATTYHTKNGTTGNVGLGYKTQYADFNAQLNSQGNLYVQVNGSVVYDKGDILFGRTIYDSYILVDAKAPGININNFSGLRGYTNSKGKMYFPIGSLSDQKVWVDLEKLPDEVMITDFEKEFSAFPQSSKRITFTTEVFE